MSDSFDVLKTHFPNYWKHIVCAAFCRLVHQSPLKNMKFHSISMLFHNRFMSPKNISIKLIGSQRNKIVDCCRSFNQSGTNLLIDMTNIGSKSQHLEFVQKGYNNHNFVSQINFLMILSKTTTNPLYYRILPGDIRDVNAFKLSLEESDIKDALIIADNIQNQTFNH